METRDINLGAWTNKNLRSMSEEAGVKPCTIGIMTGHLDLSTVTGAQFETLSSQRVSILSIGFTEFPARCGRCRLY